MGSSHSHLFKSPFSAKASHTKRRKTSSLGTTEKEEENNKKTKVMDKNTNNCHKEKIKSFNGATSLPPSPSYTANDTYKTKTVIVDGRRYQNYNTKYVLPNDDEEQDRLVQAHFIYKHLFNGNFSAPVRDLLSDSACSRRNSSGSSHSQMEEIPPPRVLDLACGNGTWMLEMATEFQNTHFYGLDISPNYPTSIKPPNALFMQYDILSPKGLPFPDNYFDFVFMRQVYTCFSRSDWTIVVEEIKRIVKPGCYVEFRDIDPILKNMGPKTHNLFEKYPEYMKERYDVDIDWAKSMYDYLQQVGEMTDMQSAVRDLRCGKSGPISHMMNNSLKSGLHSYRFFFQKNYNISPKEYDRRVNEIVDESVEYQSYFNYYACWGRKTLCDYNSPSEMLPLTNITKLDKDHRPSTSNTKNNDAPLPENDHVFGQDSVSDINEFIEGYEE